MADYLFDPTESESHQPFSLTDQFNWFLGTVTNFTPASSLPGSGDDVVFNGSDFIGGGETYQSVDDGVLDSGDLTVSVEADNMDVSMAGQPFRITNGSGGF